VPSAFILSKTPDGLVNAPLGRAQPGINVVTLPTVQGRRGLAVKRKEFRIEQMPAPSRGRRKDTRQAKAPAPIDMTHDYAFIRDTIKRSEDRLASL
jgi:hypothetical protein